MKRLRILFLTPRLPYPPDRGDRLRAYHLLRAFAGAHEVTLVSFLAAPSEYKHVEALAPFCNAVHTVTLPPWRSAASVAANVWRALPLQALYYRSRAMRSLVRHLASTERFDVAYAQLFRMAPYLKDVTGTYRIVDLTDVISRELAASRPYRSLPWRAVLAVEQGRVERYEREVSGAVEETWVISEAERTALGRAGANTQVIPNGIDPAMFYPAATPDSGARSIVFTGHLDVFHNVDALRYLVRDILPRVRARLPGCNLVVAGAGGDRSLRALLGAEGVTFRGFVPDLGAVLRAASVFVAPLRFCAGVQNKVLEAMACAVPVVVTTGVCAGLGAESGRHLLVSDDAAGIAEALLRLLEKPALHERIRWAGHTFVSQRFTWAPAVERLRVIGDSALLGGR